MRLMAIGTADAFFVQFASFPSLICETPMRSVLAETKSLQMLCPLPCIASIMPIRFGLRTSHENTCKDNRLENYRESATTAGGLETWEEST